MTVDEEIIMMKKKLADKNVDVDKSVRIFYNKNNHNNQRIHIVSIVDKAYYVVKTWSKRKHYWSYLVENIWGLYMLLENGYIKNR